MFRREVALPVGGGGEGEAVNAEEGPRDRARRRHAGKFIPSHTGDGLDAGNAQMIIHWTEGVDRVRCIFVEGRAEFIQVEIRAHLIAHLFIELRIECFCQRGGEGGKSQREYQQHQWGVVGCGTACQIACRHQQAHALGWIQQA